MPDLHSAAMIAVMALVTIAIRFLPFLIFGENRRTPELISYLGKVLPYAIMGMLVIYCLKGAIPLVAPYGLSDLLKSGIPAFPSPWGLPELIACASVVLFHVWKRNTLLSIGGGTLVYMLLVQLVFRG